MVLLQNRFFTLKSFKALKLVSYFFLAMIIQSHLTWAVPFEGQKMLIAAPSPVAVDVGKEIYAQGGNIFDVAVSVGLTLSVTSPYFASLGGGGFALIKKNGEKVSALDFREMAPQKTNEKYYSQLKEGSSWDGGPAVGVPGIPAGLYAIHKKYGKLPWKKLFKRPLELARKGFPVSGEWHKYTKSQKERFNKTGQDIFLNSKKKAYAPGSEFKQPKLYRALRLFRNKNIKGFYEGPVAKDIAKTVQKNGGVLSLSDLKNYIVKWRTPVHTKFQKHDVYVMPLPSSGGLVIKTALNLVERKNLKKYPYMSVNEFHLLGEIMAKSFRGRALLGDPDYNKLPLDQLTSKKYLKKLAKSIKVSHANRLKPLTKEKLKKESLQTTHFIVMNKKGEALSMTITLNGNYGSGVVSDKYGIALNNEMNDFQAIPGKPNAYGLLHGKANWVEPGKRPLSSMSPTIILKDDKAVFAVGAPGGPRIINGVFQTIYRVLVNNLDVEKAIMTPRLHHQYKPNVLFYEKDRFPPLVLKKLRKKHHKLKEIHGVAKVSGVRLNEEGFLEGYVDYRGEGAVGGF